MQKFFYVDNINRNQPIEAVTTTGSKTWHSVRSCGVPYVVESHEIGCVCESCVLSDGSACPNQAYCHPWKAVNLRTGKPLLDENFKNIHWPIPCDRNDSSCDGNKGTNDRNDSFRDNVDNFVSVLDESSDWDPVIDIIKNFNSYSELENYVDSLPKNVLQYLKTSVHKYDRKIHSVDEVARQTLPFDSP